MEVWFANYDTSVPFTGELYASSTNDESMHTSSIQSSTTPRAQLGSFNFGRGMLGPWPDMTKHDAAT